MNILFVCSKNLSRSPTAEMIYKDYPDVSVKSAGMEPSAGTELTGEQITWADTIFVMEEQHQQGMLAKFPAETAHKAIVILDIPDEYKFMDAALVEKIKTKVSQYIHVEPRSTQG